MKEWAGFKAYCENCGSALHALMRAGAEAWRLWMELWNAFGTSCCDDTELGLSVWRPLPSSLEFCGECPVEEHADFADGRLTNENGMWFWRRTVLVWPSNLTDKKLLDFLSILNNRYAKTNNDQNFQSISYFTINARMSHCFSFWSALNQFE